MEGDKNTSIENISSWDDLRRFVSRLIPNAEGRKANILEEKMIKNNVAVLAGKVASKPEFSFSTKNGQYFKFFIKVKRTSENIDVIPITVCKELANCIKVEDFIKTTGEFRSCNKEGHLVLSFAAETIEVMEIDREYENEVIMNAFICKDSTYRITPLGKHISDLLVAVNRSYGKSDYIPCICWRKNAFVVRELAIGTQIRIIGRIQSREYKKTLENGESVIKTAYEVSINKMEVIEECQK